MARDCDRNFINRIRKRNYLKYKPPKTLLFIPPPALREQFTVSEKQMLDYAVAK